MWPDELPRSGKRVAIHCLTLNMTHLTQHNFYQAENVTLVLSISELISTNEQASSKSKSCFLCLLFVSCLVVLQKR